MSLCDDEEVQDEVEGEVEGEIAAASEAVGCGEREAEVGETVGEWADGELELAEVSRTWPGAAEGRGEVPT
ncbi:hypothetical protein BM221_007749 [Beauveria bassiana]|uniref:Uncharacterized protein n=1 Tax=Beauveria bassiana TaxID=176275 RepID=A0A2N6NHI3_BEABA|nr:hypothetical protein BM221_007749 [Beauveria bassiana]